MRALEPTSSGIAVNPNDNVRIAYEVFGDDAAARTVVFLPTWSLVHSHHWKMQVPYFALKGFRVVTFDGRGNGKSDRPAHGYSSDHYTHDTVAVFDTIGIEQAAVVGVSAGGRWGMQFASESPERVTHLVLIGTSFKPNGSIRYDLDKFFSEPPNDDGWNKYNANFWKRDLRGFAEWFASLVCSEPHSTKAIDDAVGWALETSPDVLISTIVERPVPHLSDFASAVKCPTLIIHGTDDRLVPLQQSYDLRDAITGSKLVLMDGSGHSPDARDPIKTNHLIHEFIGHDTPRTRTWQRAQSRPKRALFVSSPIGLGHVLRDLAIADELRTLIPGLEIDWLAQPPVSAVLESRGERIHPHSCRLASESRHFESEMTEGHQLHAFYAFRNMDEILCANFTVFHDAVRETTYDLWYGDEAWDVDYYLHENPELKTAPYVFLTDFVGFVPTSHDRREAFLTADYNAEMIEQVERFPTVRDRALFIGEPEDAIPDCFGADLPSIREWTAEHFDFTGYVCHFDPEEVDTQSALRQRYGFGNGERVVIATVGGTKTGSRLLQRIVEAYPLARDLIPELRLIVVCGPRIDPSSLPRCQGVEYLGYVDRLHEMFAAADLALVQGGLSTTMELIMLQRPFLFFPLKQHFEQQRHVAFRLERHGVPEWARLSYDQGSEAIAQRIKRALEKPMQYRPVKAGGAREAAARIAQLLA